MPAIRRIPDSKRVQLYRRWEKVGLEPDLSLASLVLNWTDRRVSDLQVKGALTALSMEVSIEGASTVTMTLRDPRMHLLSQRAGRVRQRVDPKRKRADADPREVDEGWEAILPPDLLGRAVQVNLNGVVFRLVKISYSSATNEATLTFEHRLIYWLRRKKGSRRASRTHCTRAQFILALLREIRATEYRLVCPDLNVAQPVDRAKTTGSGSVAAASKAAASSDLAAGLAPNARITIKGKTATPEQRRNVEAALRRCSIKSASAKAVKALMLAIIEESECKNLAGGDADSSGILQVRASTAAGIPGLDPRDVDGVCDEFLDNGYWKYRPKGAIELAKAHPEWTAAQITQACQGSAPARYAKWNQDADTILNAWSGGDNAEAGASGGTYAKSYQFAREKDEDSWTCMQRLAEEVGRRVFVVGNSLYYMSEEALYRRRPRYEIRADDPAVLELSYDVDWGKPTSEATLRVALDRWGAPPGSNVVVSGFGPADGRWLVIAVHRDWFSPEGEVTLRQPGKAKLEPPSERSSRAATGLGRTEGEDAGDASKTAKLYRECKRISDAGGTYVYGGGHGPALSSLQSGQGLDCSSSSSLALFRAGLFKGSTAQVSGWFASSYGEPGEGERFTVWANAGHVWIQLKGLGNAWRFDTSPYGSGGRGPRLRTTQRPTSGFTARHWPGC